jgi:hypothetical protein
MQKISLFKILIGMLLISFAFRASAVTIDTFTDLGLFEAATASLTLEGFSGEPNGELWNRDFGDFSVSIDQSAKPPGGFFTRPGILWDEEIQLQTCCWWSVTRTTFDSTISALGFNWRNTDPHYGDNIELLVDGQSFVFGHYASEGFFGIVATDGVFSEVGLSDTTGGSGALYRAYIDNIRYSSGVATVPEPATAWLIVSALLGAGVIVRRKKKT